MTESARLQAMKASATDTAPAMAPVSTASLRQKGINLVREAMPSACWRSE